MALDKELTTKNGVVLRYHKIHDMSISAYPTTYIRYGNVDETGFDDIRQIGTETVYIPEYEDKVDEETGKTVKVRTGEHTEEVPKMQRNQYNISVTVRSYTDESYRQIGEDNYVLEDRLEIPVRKNNLENYSVYSVAYEALKQEAKYKDAKDC